MTILLKNVTCYDSRSSLHLKRTDILIKEGIIQQISSQIDASADRVISGDNLGVSVGWFDTSVQFGEPGFEDRGTIKNGLQVAAKSGFTGILYEPNNNPVIDTQAQVLFALGKSANELTQMYPIGALTVEQNGRDLSNIYEMHLAGAVAFGDYKKTPDDANVLKLALQYTKDLNTVVICYSLDKKLAGKGFASEGVAATKLGLKGIPALAESVEISRNIEVLRYAGGKLHFPTISTAESVAVIRRAKAAGLAVTCSVSMNNIMMTEDDYSDFDSNKKVMPPPRSSADQAALIDGLKDGTIDCITTDHAPRTLEEKMVEFEIALPGSIGLDYAFGCLHTKLETELLIDKLTAGRALFGIATPQIKEGEKANLTIFETAGTVQVGSENLYSSCKNAALLGFETKGKVVGSINNNQVVIHDTTRN
ncbi:dihydroorotase [Flavobacterium aurantiibacter]|uniref:Dihydroorotase n=1 Tax=Flavobacterium aurantiibacter TaxID=2023067 RepID=A0A255ZR25_9FLAO|nr:dihydroorotase [Flavobacterium aurantiibacter]OYQ43842.1 dihydroorotase [Flavobacterium aurantiibacter]